MSEDVRLSRIIGLECEYDIQNQAGVPQCRYIDAAATKAAGFSRAVNFLGMSGGSSKLALDIGHLELGTGEALGPASAACQDIDGIGVISSVVKASGQPHKGLYRLAGTYIHNGLVGQGSNIVRTSVGRTAGYHENYQTDRSVSVDNELIDRVFANAISSRLWALSGTLREEGFVFAQKIWQCSGEAISHNHNRRTQEKPMVQVASYELDRDIIVSPRQARIEVRCGDPGHSLVTRYLNFAANSLVLRLVENEDIVGREKMLKWSLKDPVGAMKRFAGDLSLSAVAETWEGKTIGALDLQDEQASWFEQLAASDMIELPLDEREAIPLIRETNDALRASNPAEAEYTATALARIEFAKRHVQVSRGFEQTEVNTLNNIAMARNLLWDVVLPMGGGEVYWRYVEERDPVAGRVREHNNRLGLAGRAVLRGTTIDAGETRAVGWAHMTVNDAQYCMKDPYLNEFPVPARS